MSSIVTFSLIYFGQLHQIVVFINLLSAKFIGSFFSIFQKKCFFSLLRKILVSDFSSACSGRQIVDFSNFLIFFFSRIFFNFSFNAIFSLQKQLGFQVLCMHMWCEEPSSRASSCTSFAFFEFLYLHVSAFFLTYSDSSFFNRMFSALGDRL